MKPKKLIAIVLIKNRSVLAEVRKANDDFGAGAIWIPGGHVEEGETEEQAFIREADEEMRIKPVEYSLLCILPWEKDGKNYTIYYYLCTKWKGKIKNKEASKLIWIKENEASKLDADTKTGKLDEDVDRTAFKRALEKIDEK
ncbi:MAG: NUDIX domain-containing protein [archaeon]|jgi:mutator protein MutT